MIVVHKERTMTVNTKRVVKKAAKHSVWAVADVFFLIVKAIGTLLLIAVTTGVIFSCIFLIYLRMNLTDSFDINTINFDVNLSGTICRGEHKCNYSILKGA